MQPFFEVGKKAGTTLARALIDAGADIISAVKYLTQATDKVSHRSNSLLFHYSYRLGAYDGDIYFAF